MQFYLHECKMQATKKNAKIKNVLNTNQMRIKNKEKKNLCKYYAIKMSEITELNVALCVREMHSDFTTIFLLFIFCRNIN